MGNNGFSLCQVIRFVRTETETIPRGQCLLCYKADGRLIQQTKLFSKQKVQHTSYDPKLLTIRKPNYSFTKGWLHDSNIDGVTAHRNTHTQTRTHARTHARTHTHTQGHAYSHQHMLTLSNTNVGTHKNKHTHTHTHRT